MAAMEKTQGDGVELATGHNQTEPAAAVDHDQLIAKLHEGCMRLKRQVHQVIVGQDEVIDSVLCCMLAGGHCIVQGVPGLAKTLMVHSISDAMKMQFNRIQFTPDLMPSDITGADIIQRDPQSKQREFKFVKGPLFANIV
ncbi:MAG: AAA family ATPase, partial [Phycisphaerales bacterium]